MRIVLLIALLAIIAAPACAATLDGVNLGTPVSGPRITAEDLKGRVVLFEYWGVNCPPCRRSIPHLSEWQAAYDRETFVIVANHCQGGSADNTRSVWAANGGTDQISVIDNGDLPGAKVSGIPRCFLFDHEGKLIFDGSPFDVESALKKAVEAAPGALVAGYEWTHLRKEALAIGKRQGLTAALKSVRKRAADGDEAQAEAAELLKRVEAWSAKQEAAFTAARTSDPAEAYQIAGTMAALLKGDDLAEPFETGFKALKGDKEAMNAVKAAEILAKVKALADQSGLSADPSAWLARASNKSKAQEIAGGLKMLLARYTGTKAASEAADLAKRWGMDG